MVPPPPLSDATAVCSYSSREWEPVREEKYLASFFKAELVMEKKSVNFVVGSVVKIVPPNFFDSFAPLEVDHDFTLQSIFVFPL